MKKNIFITLLDLNLPNKLNLNFNPGIGGASWSAIRLADELSKNNNYQIHLLTKAKVFFNENIRFKLIKVDQLKIESKVKNNYLIITKNILPNYYKLGILTNFDYVICLSHHPHDNSKINFLKKTNAVVSLSYYSYLSNKFKVNHYLIDVFTGIKKVNEFRYKNINKNEINIVYLGSISPGKKVHVILKEWNNISKYIKNKFNKKAIFHFVGGDLYNQYKKVGKIIPCEPSYEKILIKALNLNIDEIHKNFVFYGVQGGKNKFDLLDKMDLAILNPTGYTESSPQSALDCMSVGLPVVAGNDYGYLTLMKFFPELQINNSFKIDIYKCLDYILKDETYYNELRLRSLNVAQLYIENNFIISKKWDKLLDNLSKNNFNKYAQMMEINTKLKMKILYRNFITDIKFLIKKLL